MKYWRIFTVMVVATSSALFTSGCSDNKDLMSLFFTAGGAGLGVLGAKKMGANPVVGALIGAPVGFLVGKGITSMTGNASSNASLVKPGKSLKLASN